MPDFHQPKLCEKARELIAFCTITGKYQFKRLPMGICNSPSKYQEAMNKIMTYLSYKMNVNYIDDCTCFGKPFDDHLSSLELILERSKQYNLKLKYPNVNLGYLMRSKENILIKLRNSNYKCNKVFEVVDYNGLPLLSYEACIALNYIEKEKSANEIEAIELCAEKENII
ncbi:Reverse transcriptase domain [Cinara cedri]|uniref:Reverse transcriptase domain n=1 Tax=Cinara cedri TaxID=506608 RepID=A0A5E4M797_9HEMI|nr:Reverse transcriptase domain [Cinara cedri]